MSFRRIQVGSVKQKTPYKKLIGGFHALATHLNLLRGGLSPE